MIKTEAKEIDFSEISVFKKKRLLNSLFRYVQEYITPNQTEQEHFITLGYITNLICDNQY